MVNNGILVTKVDSAGFPKWLMGKLSEIDATMGEYLQIRPKASNGQSLCYGFDEEGSKILTLPRGFYLRSRFTNTIVNRL